MKLTGSWFFLLPLVVALVSGGLFTRNDLQTSRDKGLEHRPQRSTGHLYQGRQRLFARRGHHYERQRIHNVTPQKVHAVLSNAPTKPSKMPPKEVMPVKSVKPAKSVCTPHAHSCSPQSSCCDFGATCHCRFFNAICHCRKKSSLRKNKTYREKTPAGPK